MDLSEDITGRRLIYKIKEHFRASSRFQIVDDKGTFLIIINTLPKYDDTPDAATIYSVVWTLRTESSQFLPKFIDTTLGYCGKQFINETAENIIAETDKLTTQLNKITDEALKSLNH